jgi:hypothetical protein
MKQTINLYQFRDAFQECRPDNFSYDGLRVLFEYFEQFEDDTGDELELDVIAICCDFSEESVEDIAKNYSIDLSECEDDEEKAEAVRDYLESDGALIGEVEGGFVYRNF